MRSSIRRAFLNAMNDTMAVMAMMMKVTGMNSPRATEQSVDIRARRSSCRILPDEVTSDERHATANSIIG
jgi:hypothetical protein